MDSGVEPYLILSDNNNTIYYTSFKNYVVDNTTYRGALKVEELIPNLTYKPSAMEFCFKMQILYVCSSDQGYIYAYKVKI